MITDTLISDINFSWLYLLDKTYGRKNHGRVLLFFQSTQWRRSVDITISFTSVIFGISLIKCIFVLIGVVKLAFIDKNLWANLRSLSGLKSNVKINQTHQQTAHRHDTLQRNQLSSIKIRNWGNHLMQMRVIYSNPIYRNTSYIPIIIIIIVVVVVVVSHPNALIYIENAFRCSNNGNLNFLYIFFRVFINAA
jgi:hypothetical protein